MRCSKQRAIYYSLPYRSARAAKVRAPSQLLAAILNSTRIMPCISQGVAAGVLGHVATQAEREARTFTDALLQADLQHPT
jgi:hypothetical protein